MSNSSVRPKTFALGDIPSDLDRVWPGFLFVSDELKQKNRLNNITNLKIHISYGIKESTTVQQIELINHRVKHLDL